MESSGQGHSFFFRMILSCLVYDKIYFFVLALLELAHQAQLILFSLLLAASMGVFPYKYVVYIQKRIPKYKYVDLFWVFHKYV